MAPLDSDAFWFLCYCCFVFMVGHRKFLIFHRCNIIVITIKEQWAYFHVVLECYLNYKATLLKPQASECHFTKCSALCDNGKICWNMDSKTTVSCFQFLVWHCQGGTGFQSKLCNVCSKKQGNIKNLVVFRCLRFNGSKNSVRSQKQLHMNAYGIRF